MTSLNATSQVDILIVDDTLNNVRLLADMLSKSGYSVRKAISGSMALTAARAAVPDLILLDINMPDMTGYDVCQQLKSEPYTAEIPIIFLSALDGAVDKVMAFKVGGADYISKPFQHEEVLVRIQNQLTICQLRSQLTQRNLELERALTQLKQSQAELVQKHTLLGLGQLTAGVAHEINNPINFIAGNLEPAREYFGDLTHVLALYRQHCPEPGAEILEAIAVLDLDYIIQDLEKLLRSMGTGTTRIVDIVQALQTFSHINQAEIKAIDLRQSIRSTLVLLEPRFRAQSTRPAIHLVYDQRPLPLVTCYAKLIHQAILNLLVNALDALDARWQDSVSLTSASFTTDADAQPPTLWITTDSEFDQSVKLSIRDNGIGIPDEIKAHVYDPFFTTKPVGQGVGLGLSTCYQTIVEKHGGKLSFTSSPSTGSEFTIQIPLKGCAGMGE